jgi:hypothetical protein
MKIAHVLARMAVASVAVASVAAGAGTDFTQQGAADPRGRVDIANFYGSVEVTTWDRPEFALDAQLEEDVERVDVTSRDGTTWIHVLLKKNPRKRSANLKVSVPFGSRIEVSTVSASIVQRGRFTSSQLRAVSGSVKVEGAGEELEVRSISGSVEIDGGGTTGRTLTESVSGSIRARDVIGEFQAQTTSGSIGVSMPSAQRVRVRSVTGRADIEATLVPMARVEVESVSGSADARLRAEQGFSYDLSSYSGSVNNCFTGGQETGSVGAASGNVRMRTHSASITLCDK